MVTGGPIGTVDTPSYPSHLGARVSATRPWLPSLDWRKETFQKFCRDRLLPFNPTVPKIIFGVRGGFQISLLSVQEV